MVLLVTTNAGNFDFSNVTYGGAAIAGYTASVDAATGLEAIQFTAADQFQGHVAEGAGPFAGSYLWSNQTNWSAGVPANGASVSTSAPGIDDLANLTLNAVTVNSGDGVADYGGALNIGTAALAVGGSLTADADIAAVTAIPTVTVGSITSTGGSVGAVGPNATFIDNSTIDPGNNYFAFNGKVVLAPALADSSTLNYSGNSGTFALEHPNTVTNAAISGSSPDVRTLGLCVGRWQIDGVDVPLEDSRQFESGWHGLEEYPGRRQRWTFGRVPLPAGTRLLVIDVAAPSHCWVSPASAARADARRYSVMVPRT